MLNDLSSLLSGISTAESELNNLKPTQVKQRWRISNFLDTLKQRLKGYGVNGDTIAIIKLSTCTPMCEGISLTTHATLYLVNVPQEEIPTLIKINYPDTKLISYEVKPIGKVI